MLASRLPSILPPLSDEEMIESAALRSLHQTIDEDSIQVRPFRSPHHSASAVALVGGGSDPRPGEISLAHHGVLFLDELPEFGRNVLEVLREPLETGQIHISRAARQATFPAQFQLVAAMNPCPCGYLGHVSKPCRCSGEMIARYQGKISGPLLDRIDLSINVPSLSQDDLANQEAGECSADVKARVVSARAKQMARQGKINARLSVSDLDQVANIHAEAKVCLGQMMTKLSLSARSYHRLLRVARTVADLDDHTWVTQQHVLKAVSFRRI
nr:ATP-binding protein [Neisseriaceae bacterium]